MFKNLFDTFKNLDVRMQNHLLAYLVIFQILAYFVVGVLANPNGTLAVPQPDSLLYYQAARRIVEGHPFSFSAGTAVSTGTTSVLHPFVLAIPYALGCQGDALVTAGFALNALFYILFVFGWVGCFRAVLRPTLAWYAALLLVLCPQPICCAFHQTDQGLWLAVSALFLRGLARGQPLLYVPFLWLAPWIRPEGMVLAFIFGVWALFARRKRDIAFAVLAGVSVVGVFALNYALTGVPGFSSTAGKGYFTQLPWAGAVCHTFGDFITLLREVFLGQSASAPRNAYLVPVLGGLAFVVGLVYHRWTPRRDGFLAVALVAGTLGVLVVASSQWQGLGCDRYLAWIMPLVILFGAVGWDWASHHAGAAGAAVLLVPVLFSLGAQVDMLAGYHACCASVNQEVAFTKQCAALLPAESSVADVCGVYYMGNRRCPNLWGIYSPEFITKDFETIYDILKNEPATRFDYWYSTGKRSGAPEGLQTNAAPVLSSLQGGLKITKVDWRRLDAARDFHGFATNAAPKGTLKARIDVGYERGEKEAGYRIECPYLIRPFKPFSSYGRVGATVVFDVGRVVAGRDEMTVSGLAAGQDVTVGLRTANKVAVPYIGTGGDRRTGELDFKKALDLAVTVDGQEVHKVHLPLSTNRLDDVSFTLPGKYVTRPVHRIGFKGDHTAFGYWFFQ